MIDYLLNDDKVVSTNYELVRDFMKSISVSVEQLENVEPIVCKGIDLICLLFSISLEERENEKITNLELKTRVQFLRSLSLDFIKYIESTEGRIQKKNDINDMLSDVSIYCEVDEI